MIRYCELCGQLTGEDHICRNPNCKGNNTPPVPTAQTHPSLSRPVHLADRLKQREYRPQQPETSRPHGVDWDDDWDDEDWNEDDERDDREAPFDPEPPVGDPRSYSHSNPPTGKRRGYGIYAAGRAGGHPELLWIPVSVLASAIGTLIFGAMYLEDFILRWVVTGVITPMLAYGFSGLYGWLLIAPIRKAQGPTGRLLPELISVVALSAKLPTALLILSCFLSPLDQNLGVFQFFALLLVIVWVVCLCHALLTSYKGPFSKWAPILTILFAFLALTTLRSIWVWYITGEFRFTLHIPLSVFL